MGLLSQGGGNTLTLLANGAWNDAAVSAKKLYSRITTTDEPDADFTYLNDYTSGTVNIDTDRTRYAQGKYRWYQEMVAIFLDDSVSLDDYTHINFEWTSGKDKFDCDIVPAAGVESMTDNYFDTGAASMALDDVMLSAGSDTVRLCSQHVSSSTVCEITKIWLS